ncbi:hypothetical protein ARMSODRAFT_983718 [Armillaria solidipes]|uniref:Uncharacterized protein n=1 Tax=Armillaria solidipes TaxID=1076256 RepID=A0A2H3B6D1_9AGAR|nr:hypothetical protein ARMSODRAFT_983718 [Armillaria solidipes]
MSASQILAGTEVERCPYNWAPRVGGKRRIALSMIAPMVVSHLTRPVALRLMEGVIKGVARPLEWVGKELDFERVLSQIMIVVLISSITFHFRSLLASVMRSMTWSLLSFFQSSLVSAASVGFTTPRITFILVVLGFASWKLYAYHIGGFGHADTLIDLTSSTDVPATAITSTSPDYEKTYTGTASNNEPTHFVRATSDPEIDKDSNDTPWPGMAAFHLRFSVDDHDVDPAVAARGAGPTKWQIHRVRVDSLRKRKSHNKDYPLSGISLIQRLLSDIITKETEARDLVMKLVWDLEEYMPRAASLFRRITGELLHTMGQLNVAVYEEVIAHRARRSDHMGQLITLLGGHKTLTEELKQTIATLESIYNDIKRQWLEDKALGHRVCELSGDLEGSIVHPIYGVENKSPASQLGANYNKADACTYHMITARTRIGLLSASFWHTHDLGHYGAANETGEVWEQSFAEGHRRGFGWMYENSGFDARLEGIPPYQYELAAKETRGVSGTSWACFVKFSLPLIAVSCVVIRVQPFYL